MRQKRVFNNNNIFIDDFTNQIFFEKRSFSKRTYNIYRLYNNIIIIYRIKKSFAGANHEYSI